MLGFLLNHWMLTLSFIGALIALFGLNIWEQRGIARVTPLEAVQLINHKEAWVLDLRAQAVFVEGHILGAMNIPMATLEKKITQLQHSAKQAILLITTTPQDIKIALMQLKNRGYLDIRTIEGGMSGWRQASLPLVKK